MNPEKGIKERYLILWPVLILCIFITGSCIDTFKPQLKDYHPLIVVDALLTDEDLSSYVYLSGTIKDPKDNPKKVTDAYIEIRDDVGNKAVLTEIATGKYRTDSLTFRGVPGRTYTLYIRTRDGKEFESEPCRLNHSRGIDTIYFAKGTEVAGNGVDNIQGVYLFFDSKDQSESRYFRWVYEEWWEFRTPYPRMYNYINSKNIVEIAPEKDTCWKNVKSGEIILQSAEETVNDEFIKKPVMFIPSEASDRLLIQYYVHAKQYAISRREYEFWEQMKMITESGGDIFDKQPFQIVSNIHGINGTEDKVLGFFQVAGVSDRQLYLTRREVDLMNLPMYDYGCELLFINPGTVPVQLDPPVTFDKIYALMTGMHYIFVMPVYSDLGFLENLVFVEGPCSDCTLTGTMKKPDFWTDME